MITVDANSLEARYGGKMTGGTQGTPDLYAPGMAQPPSQQGQIPQGTPVPEGTVISQVMGRGQPAPSISVVPPPQPGGPPPPQVAVVPPQIGNRTSIGTIVESKTNPMVGTQAVVDAPSDTTNVVAEDKPKRKLDLVMTVLNYIAELGGEKSEEAQKFFDRSDQALKQWYQQPARIPLEALIKIMAKKPGLKIDLAEQLEPHFAIHDNGNGIQSLPNRGQTNAVLCTPVLGQPTLPHHWNAVYLAKKYQMGFDVQADTAIWRSRNMLADRFLKSGATWSLWLDADVAAPIKNRDWFRWLTGSQVISDESCQYDVWERLQMAGKAVVGGVYAARRYQGQLVIQPEIRPRSHEDKLLCNDIRKGTARGLIEVDWIGFGCALVHKEVFLEVQRRFPQLAPQAEGAPWRYFQPLGDEGEDEAFCQRVKACGIPIWLDTQLVCGHIGNMAFLPEHTRSLYAL
jgi:hypothetical protein